MSISTELTRLQTLRNGIRAKLTAWGILTNAAATLSDCKDAIDSVANNGAVSQTLDANTTTYTVPAGYHNGSGTVQVVTETKTVTANGTVSASAGKLISSFTVNVDNAPELQQKSVTPSEQAQTISPDSGYDGLSQVTVGAIPDNYGDISGVTAVAANVLATKIFVNSSGAQTTGTMLNNGAVAQTIDGMSVTSYTIPAGYHSGTGTVSLDSTIETALAAI